MEISMPERTPPTTKQITLKGRASLAERKSECKYLWLSGKEQK